LNAQPNPGYAPGQVFPTYSINPPQGQQFQLSQGTPMGQPGCSYPVYPQHGQQFQSPQGFPQNQLIGSYPTNPLPGQQFQSPQGFPQNQPIGSYPTNPLPGQQFQPSQGYPANHPLNMFIPNSQSNSLGQQDLKPLPSLKAKLDSKPEQDASSIHKAFKGFGIFLKDDMLGSDWKEVMNILTHRTSAQRIKIKEHYTKLYKKSIIERTKSEFSGQLEILAVALEHVGPDMDAYFIRKSIKGVGTDDFALINILCTRSGSQITAIKEMFGKSLLNDVKSDTSGNYGDLLCHLINTPRDLKAADPVIAEKHGHDIYSNNTIKINPPKALIPILCTSSYEQIKLIMYHFKKVYYFCNIRYRTMVKHSPNGLKNTAWVTMLKRC
ncbi:hypothetical protein MXB_5065, partial [Myxobolus squamalis]